MKPARIALLLTSLYLAFGFVQRGRALQAARELADARGHVVERIDAFPAPPVDFLWRTAYVSDGIIHVDQVRTPWWSATVASPGESIPLATEADMPPAVRDDPRTREAFETFQWFANGWVAWQREDGSVLGDLRYGLEEGSVDSMWGVRLRPGQPQPVTAYRADMSTRLDERWDALWGRDRD